MHTQIHTGICWAESPTNYTRYMQGLAPIKANISTSVTFAPQEEREKKKERGGERQRERQTETDRDRDRQRQIEREKLNVCLVVLLDSQ